MWDSSHTHTHHTINQIGASQSPPLKSLTSLLGPTLWSSVFEPIWGYRALIPYVTTQGKTLATFTLYFKKISHN